MTAKNLLANAEGLLREVLQTKESELSKVSLKQIQLILLLLQTIER